MKSKKITKTLYDHEKVTVKEYNVTINKTQWNWEKINFKGVDNPTVKGFESQNVGRWFAH